ncbi:hypothetical protein ACF0H5_012920 [Mactra antiquata]
MKVIFTVLFCSVFLATVHGICLDGWMYYQNSCYLFGHHDLDFIEAEKFCDHYHAKLVEIETARENTFLKSFLGDLKDQNHWIGLVDEVVENEWRWHSDDSITNFTDWYPNKPSGGKASNCVVVEQRLGYQWLDVPCTSSYRPLCEKPFGDVEVVVG